MHVSPRPSSPWPRAMLRRGESGHPDGPGRELFRQGHVPGCAVQPPVSISLDRIARVSESMVSARQAGMLWVFFGMARKAWIPHCRPGGSVHAACAQAERGWVDRAANIRCFASPAARQCTAGTGMPARVPSGEPTGTTPSPCGRDGSRGRNELAAPQSWHRI